MIKVLNHHKVVVLSLYETSNLDLFTVNRLNAIIRDISLSNKFIYIDINEIIKKENFLNTKSHYLNYEAHKLIYKEIKKKNNQYIS